MEVIKFIKKGVKLKNKTNLFLNLGTGVARNTTQILEYLGKAGIYPKTRTRRRDIPYISWADTTRLERTFNSVPESSIILK